MNRLIKTNKLGLKCEILISDFNDWQNREIYIELIENFLNDKIDVKEFEKKFLSLWKSNLDEDKSWERFVYIINNFKLNQFQGFSSLISKLFTDLEVLEPDLFLRQDYEIGEDDFRECLKKILIEIKNRYS